MRTTFTQIRAIRVDGTTCEVEGLTAERARRSIIRVLDGIPLGHGPRSRVAARHTSTPPTTLIRRISCCISCPIRSPSIAKCERELLDGSSDLWSEQKWTDPGRGLQLFGRCDRLKGAHAELAERAYGRRFRVYADWKGSLEPGDAALDYRFYRFVAHRVKTLDEAEFGDAVWVEVQVGCGSQTLVCDLTREIGAISMRAALIPPV